MVLLNVIAWLPGLVFTPLPRSAFREVLTLGASPALLLDAAPPHARVRPRIPFHAPCSLE